MGASEAAEPSKSKMETTFESCASSKRRSCGGKQHERAHDSELCSGRRPHRRHRFKIENSFESRPSSKRRSCGGKQLDLYMLLPVPILHGMYCKKALSGGNTVLRNSVSDKGRQWSAQARGVFANNSIDSCTKASNSTNIL